MRSYFYRSCCYGFQHYKQSLWWGFKWILFFQKEAYPSRTVIPEISMRSCNNNNVSITSHFTSKTGFCPTSNCFESDMPGANELLRTQSLSAAIAIMYGPKHIRSRTSISFLNVCAQNGCRVEMCHSWRQSCLEASVHSRCTYFHSVSWGDMFIRQLESLIRTYSLN